MQPHDVLLLLAVAIWIDGLWLIKRILWKAKPKARGAAVLSGKGPEPRVDSLSDLNYQDPWTKQRR